MSKRTILITGLISNDPIDVKALLKKVEQVAKELGIELQLVDASKVYGKEHLEIAAEKAIRAFDEGRNFGKTLAVEVILYASREADLRGIEVHGPPRGHQGAGGGRDSWSGR